MNRALALAALAALASCSGADEQREAKASEAPPVAAAKPPSDSRLPDHVLLAWAQAMSTKDWASAYRYWGDDGAASGLSAAEFAAKWGKLADPEFELHGGKTERAAGSLFYTAPLVLIDGTRRVEGKVVLRRMAGAANERWQIDRLTIEP